MTKWPKWLPNFNKQFRTFKINFSQMILITNKWYMVWKYEIEHGYESWLLSIFKKICCKYYLPANFKLKNQGGGLDIKRFLLMVNQRGWGQDPSKTPIGHFYNPKNKNSKSAGDTQYVSTWCLPAYRFVFFVFLWWKKRIKKGPRTVRRNIQQCNKHKLDLFYDANFYSRKSKRKT